MRTFQVMPTSPGQPVHHLWVVVATAEDGTEVPLGTYETMQEAVAAKAVLDRNEVENRR